METLKIAQQVLSFNKTVFDNTYTGMTVMQEYSENMINGYLRQFPWITEENTKPLFDSIDFMKKAREDYKSAVDQGFEKLAEMTTEK